MMSVEIYLPMNDNQGTPFPEPVFTRIETALTEKLGGVTAYKRVHAQGRWKSEVPTPTKSQFSKSSSARSIWSGGAIVASPLNGKAIVQDAADAVQLGRIGLHGNDGAAVSDRLREMGVPRRLGSGRRRRANGPAGDGCRPRSNNGRGEPADGDDRAEPGDGHHAQAGEQPAMPPATLPIVAPWTAWSSPVSCLPIRLMRSAGIPAASRRRATLRASSKVR
jgi:hypothetical protein